MNKEKVESPERIVDTGDLIAGRYLVLQKGKKNYFLIIAE